MWTSSAWDPVILHLLLRRIWLFDSPAGGLVTALVSGVVGDAYRLEPFRDAPEPQVHLFQDFMKAVCLEK